MPTDTKIAPEPRLATKNHILQSLPPEDFARISPDLEPVKFASGETIYHSNSKIEYVYFPNHAMASVVATTSEGQCAEAGVIGREGIVGAEALMGTDTNFNETFIQLPDGALRMKTARARAEFKRAGAFHDLSLSFIRLLMLQISQTALCNRLHTVEERLARWLLLCRDRSRTDELKLTQEFLGIMLATNRSTVTTAAITLQGGGLIKYSRGLITIIDREGLEHFSCECYRTVKAEYDRVQQ